MPDEKKNLVVRRSRSGDDALDVQHSKQQCVSNGSFTMTPLAANVEEQDCWSNSRQASELLGEAPEENKTKPPQELYTVDETPGYSVPDSSQQTEELERNAGHITRCISYNPYNPQDPCIVHTYCPCAHCQSLHNLDAEGSEGVNSQEPSFEMWPVPQHHSTALPPPMQPSAMGYASSSGMTPSISPQQRHFTAPPSPINFSSASSSCYDQLPPPPPPHHFTSTTAVRENGYAAGPPHNQLSFMPPPPPPRITVEILSGEGSTNASSKYYHTMLRWYRKLHSIQHFWVPPEEMCPVPAEPYTFDEWCDLADYWWFVHFGHMQMKAAKYNSTHVAELKTLW